MTFSSGVRVQVWTLTVEHPNAGITTTVYSTEQEALAELQEWYRQMYQDPTPIPDADIVQALCDSGYCIYLDCHTLPITNLREASK